MRITASLTGADAIQRQLARLQDGMRGPAIQMAVNKVAQKAQVEIRRAVTAEYKIDAALVRGSLNLQRAQRRSGREEAVIDIFGSPTKRGRSMNMVRFLAAFNGMKTRGSKANKKAIAALGKELGFQIKRSGGMKTLPGVFVGNKGRTVFIRTNGQMDSRPGNLTKHSQKIKAVQVIGVSQMFSSRKISGRIVSKVQADLLTEIERAVAALLARG